MCFYAFVTVPTELICSSLQCMGILTTSVSNTVSGRLLASRLVLFMKSCPFTWDMFPSLLIFTASLSCISETCYVPWSRQGGLVQKVSCGAEGARPKGSPLFRTVVTCCTRQVQHLLAADPDPLIRNGSRLRARSLINLPHAADLSFCVCSLRTVTP